MRSIFTFIFFVFTVATYAQEPFNWTEQELGPGNNLKGMIVADDNSAVIVGMENTVLRSTDMGASWDYVDLIPSNFNFNGLSMQGMVGYATSTRSTIVKTPSEGDIKVNGVILKTTDGGASWSPLSLDSFGEGENTALNPSLPGCYELDFQAVSCIDENIAYVSLRWSDVSTGKKTSHSAVLKTNDGGLTWKAISQDYGSDIISCTQQLNENTVFFGGNKIFFKANIETDEITDLHPILDEGEDDKMYISDIGVYNNTELIITTVTDGIYTTNDIGETYTKIEGLSGANDFFKYNDDVMLALGSSSKSKATTDGGATWTECYPGSSCWDIGGVFNDSLIALAKENIYKLAISDLVAGNYNWISQSVHSGEILHKMSVVDENTAVIIGYGNGVKITTNKGLIWDDATMPRSLISGILFDFNDISQGADGTSFIVARREKWADYEDKFDEIHNGLIFKSKDNWLTWELLDNTKIGVETHEDPSKCPTAEGCFGADMFQVECVDELTAYLYVNWYDTITVEGESTQHGRIFKTIDGGNVWTPISNDFGKTFISFIKFYGEEGYIGGNKALIKTTDGGASFTDLFPALSEGTEGNQYINTVKKGDEGTLYVVTTNHGVAYSTNEGDTFTYFDGIAGGSDIFLISENSFITGGSRTKTLFTNTSGKIMEEAYPGSTIWAFGEVLNDELYALCKGKAYKISLTELKERIISSINENDFETHKLNVSYSSDYVIISSTTSDINSLEIYNINGSLVKSAQPNTDSYKINNKAFTAGTYIVRVRTNNHIYSCKIILQ